MGDGEREGEKLIHAFTRVYRNEKSNQAPLSKHAGAGAWAPASVGAEFAMLNTLVEMGSESTVMHRDRPTRQGMEQALPSRSSQSGVRGGDRQVMVPRDQSMDG